MQSHLTEKERKVLEFEASWRRVARTKAEAIASLGMSVAQYYLVLNRALSRAEAEMEFPDLVRRSIRLREKRARERHGWRGAGA